jgi:hypothetical protein
MKEFFVKLFDIHSTLGKIFTTSTSILVILGVIGSISKWINPQNIIVEENYFIGDKVPLHDNNYEFIVNYAFSSTEYSIVNKDGVIESIEGNLIIVNITLSKSLISELKPYYISVNDFKIKDHTGVYIPLNSIMGAMGWDAIDLHIDDKNGVMSSTSFQTTKAYKDYSYYEQQVSTEQATYNIVFSLADNVKVENDLIVLEIDFYVGNTQLRKGSDIILLPKPSNES